MSLGLLAAPQPLVAHLSPTAAYIHKFENLRRDRQDAEDLRNGVVHPVIENEEFLDLTDKQQRGFRYPI